MSRQFVRPVGSEARQFNGEQSLARPGLETSAPRESKAVVEVRDAERHGHGGSKSISILLIHENRIFRMGLAALLKRKQLLRILADSEKPEDAPRSGRGQGPDIVLLDVGADDAGNLVLVRRTRAIHPEARLIVMGMTQARAEILPLLKEGVAGFLLKDASLHHFVAAIRAVAAGQTVFPSILMQSLLSRLFGDASRNSAGQVADGKLTVREGEIFSLIAEGLSNKEIGRSLSIATETVKSHVHNILEKLSLRSRVEIAARARRALSAH